MSDCTPEKAHISRRQALFAGALGSIGLSLPQLLRAEAQANHAGSPIGRAKSIILIVPWGGPAQLDTFDLKPHAPAEIRGPYQPIATRVPGTRICQHLPRLAALADKFAIVRSMSHRIGTHNPATHLTLTGHPPLNTRELAQAERSDWPSLGSVLAKLRPSQAALPSYVQLPLPLIDNNAFSGGQHAGFLGTAFDPMVIARDPNRADFTVPGLDPQPDVGDHRLDERTRLLGQLDRHADRWRQQAAVAQMVPYYDRAHDLLRSAATRQAFDVSQEAAAVRDRYGRTRLGQSMLLARRLIETGVRLVLVSDTTENTNGKWDTHEGNSYAGITRSLTETDHCLSALLQDLDQRGMLAETIVLWMAEFGRTPRITSAGGGRDHWPSVYSMLLAGGGIRGGALFGSSDSTAAFPRENPVAPEDIHATLYRLLGVPADTMIADPIGRPLHLCHGTAVRAIMESS